MDLLILLALYFEVCLALYEYVPGSLYKSFAPLLKFEQKIEVMKLVFDTHKSREDALKDVRDWCYRQSPLTEQALDRAIFDYEAWIETENKHFTEYEAKLSDDAWQLGTDIRAILTNMSLSEHTTCNQLSQLIDESPKDIQQELKVEPVNCTALFDKLRDQYNVIL